jgi:hypothetical protein
MKTTPGSMPCSTNYSATCKRWGLFACPVDLCRHSRDEELIALHNWVF